MFRIKPLTLGRCLPGLAALLLLVAIQPLPAQTLSPLTSRGYTVLPIPQTVTLGPVSYTHLDVYKRQVPAKL